MMESKESKESMENVEEAQAVQDARAVIREICIIKVIRQ